MRGSGGACVVVGGVHGCGRGSMLGWGVGLCSFGVCVSGCGGVCGCGGCAWLWGGMRDGLGTCVGAGGTHPTGMHSCSYVT